MNERLSPALERVLREIAKGGPGASTQFIAIGKLVLLRVATPTEPAIRNRAVRDRAISDRAVPDLVAFDQLGIELVQEFALSRREADDLSRVARARGILTTPIDIIWENVGRDQVPRQAPTAAEARIVESTLALASTIIVGAREEAPAEWTGEKAAGEAGEADSAIKRLRFSLGLVRAAVQIRTSRAAAPVIELADRTVRSESRTRGCVTATVAVIVLYVFHKQGLTGVISDGESLLAIGAGVYAVARWRRKVLIERDKIAGKTGESD